MVFSGLSSWAVLGLMAASAAALALLHLLRVRPRERRVVTTLFWVHVVERTRARTLLERFRHPLTYLLLLAICVLISLALGQPQRKLRPADRIHRVLIVDAGADMGARDRDGHSRLELAREAVLAEAGRMAADDALAVMLLDPEPRLIHRFGEPLPLLARGLDAMAPAALPGDRDRAIGVARALLNGRSHPGITLVTARAFKDDKVAENPDAAVRVVQVGTPVNNAAILSALFVPDQANPLRGKFLARVAAYGSAPRQVTILIQRAGGAPLLSESATLSAGGTHDFAVADLPADGDVLNIRLSPGDDLAIDDEASFHLPLRNPIRIGDCEEVPPGLRVVLESNPAVRIAAGMGQCDICLRLGSSAGPRMRAALLLENAVARPPGAALTTAAGHPFFRGLDFEGAAQPGSLRDGVLIASGKVELARWVADTKAPRLVLNAGLWSDDLAITHQGAFAVFVARAVAALAGWDPDPVVLDPSRVCDDPLWTERAGLPGNNVVMPANRASADLTATADATTESSQPASRWTASQWFEILLAAALILFLVDAYLHMRGRIS